MVCNGNTQALLYFRETVKTNYCRIQTFIAFFLKIAIIGHKSAGTQPVVLTIAGIPLQEVAHGISAIPASVQHLL